MSLKRCFIHGLGIGCLGSAVVLQILVFWSIFETGVFMATEQNQTVLSIELFLSIFALAYFVYLIPLRYKDTL